MCGTAGHALGASARSVSDQKITSRRASYLEQPVQGGLLGARVLARHGCGADHALDLARVDGIDGGEGLGGEGPVLVLLVAELLDDDGEGTDSLLANVLGLLAREARQEVAEGGEASVDESGVLGGGGVAQGFKELGNARLGDVVLLDGRLDVGDHLDLVVEGGTAAQHVDQVGDLLVGEPLSHDVRRDGVRVDYRKTLIDGELSGLCLALFLLSCEAATCLGVGAGADSGNSQQHS